MPPFKPTKFTLSLKSPNNTIRNFHSIALFLLYLAWLVELKESFKSVSFPKGQQEAMNDIFFLFNLFHLKQSTIRTWYIFRAKAVKDLLDFDTEDFSSQEYLWFNGRVRSKSKQYFDYRDW